MPYKDLQQQRIYQNNWMLQRRLAFFEDKRCVLCGSTDRMELDHKEPGKKVTHRIWSWSQKRRDAEIAKCQVLCYECHKKKTCNDIQERVLRTPIQHGTRNGYRIRDCRCNKCVDYMNKARTSWNRGCGLTHQWTVDDNPPGGARGSECYPLCGERGTRLRPVCLSVVHVTTHLPRMLQGCDSSRSDRHRGL